MTPGLVGMIPWRVGQSSAAWAQENGIPFFYKASLESTNDLAKEEAFAETSIDQPLKIYLADFQSRGRGRNQHTWESPEEGSSLLSSWSFLSTTPPLPQLTCHVGLGLFRALHSTWPTLNFWLKAPNDIYLGEKKLAGLLIETLQQGEHVRVIIGLGLNVLALPHGAFSATFLAAHLNVVKELWPLFLDRLYLEFVNSFSVTQNLNLRESEKKALLWALNRNPFLAMPFSDIKEDGSLVSGDKVISWESL